MLHIISKKEADSALKGFLKFRDNCNGFEKHKAPQQKFAFQVPGTNDTANDVVELVDKLKKDGSFVK
jgi:hypothetical protein